MARDGRRKSAKGQVLYDDEDLRSLAALITATSLISNRIRSDAVTALLQRALAALLTVPGAAEPLSAEEPVRHFNRR